MSMHQLERRRASRQRKAKRALLLPKDKLLVTIDEAAELLSMSRAKLYPKLTGEGFHPWVNNGLRTIKVDGQRLCLLADVEAYARKMGGRHGATEEE